MKSLTALLLLSVVLSASAEGQLPPPPKDTAVVEGHATTAQTGGQVRGRVGGPELFPKSPSGSATNSVPDPSIKADSKKPVTTQFAGLSPAEFLRLQGYLAESAAKSPEMIELRRQVLDLYRRQNEVLLDLAIKAHPQDADKLKALVAEMNRRMTQDAGK